MRKTLFLILTLFAVFTTVDARSKKDQDRALIDKVAMWQIDHQTKVKHHDLAWTNGVLFRGMVEWADYTQDSRYYDFLMQIGKKHRWGFLKRLYHADDLVIAQMYIRMYEKYHDPVMIQPTIARVDSIVAKPSKARLWLGAKNWSERWSWCDALFMAPPVYAKMYMLTNDRKYVDFMNQEYKATYNYLFDKEKQLFYRDHRYFGKKEANGERVFWGRGNGWVLGGLCEILQALPRNNMHREFYQDLFVRLSNRMASLQGEDGYWHASLLDPKSYPSPETSATGFIVYALAYGVNEGLLDKEQMIPVIKKGWEALVKAVEKDGKLGYVQPIGADPKKVTREMTEVYGVGAFLLAGNQMYKLVSTHLSK